MTIKIIAGLVAIVLLAGFVGPVAWKLKETALWAVVLIGFGMMLFDLWQSLESKDD